MPGLSPLERVERTFREQGIDWNQHLTSGPKEATEVAARAAKSGFDCVVAIGGDGTINEVVNGLANTEVACGVIPLGTENVLAREMGIPYQPERACLHLLESPPRHLDLGVAGDRYFACFAGVGFDAHVAYHLDPKLKASLGSLAYVLTSLEQFQRYQLTPRRVSLWIDGQSIDKEFWILLVGNIQTYGGHLRPAPRAQPDDGLLDLCLFPKTTYAETARQLLASVQGRHLDLPGVLYYQGRSFRIESDPVERIQLDGEAGGTTPVQIDIAPAALLARF